MKLGLVACCCRGAAKAKTKDVFLRGFELEASERADLLAFLESLTDDEFLNDPRYADPFEPDSTR